MTNLPAVFKFKYRIGDMFTNAQGDSVEVTGYNHIFGCYKTKTIMKFENMEMPLESALVGERELDKMKKVNNEEELNKMAMADRVRYKIYYFEQEAGQIIKGTKVESFTVELTSVRALAKMLNGLRKRNPNRRITLVSVVDENDKYLAHVKFLPQEIVQQKFLTGWRERMLASAKYERGYEVAIGF
jgi:hypothetical protein